MNKGTLNAKVARNEEHDSSMSTKLKTISSQPYTFKIKTQWRDVRKWKLKMKYMKVL